jgi:methionyl-tRNA formyltransferase
MGPRTLPKHARGRRPRIVLIEPAETQARTLTPTQMARVDAALNTVAAAPDEVKAHATASALRDYQHDGIRVIFYATALGSILIVTYIEAD